jgi:hypothetical protein
VGEWQNELYRFLRLAFWAAEGELRAESQRANMPTELEAICEGLRAESQVCICTDELGADGKDIKILYGKYIRSGNV